MKNLRAKIEILTQDEILQIHKASLKILEHTGMGMPNKECLTRCRNAGAVVDFDKEVMRIPASVMEDLLSEYRRNHPQKEDSMVREPIQGSISTQVFVVDYETKKRRYGLSDDVQKGIALVQHLDNISSCNAVCVLICNCTSIPKNTEGPISCLRKRHSISWIWRNAWDGRNIISLRASAPCVSARRPSRWDSCLQTGDIICLSPQ